MPKRNLQTMWKKNALNLVIMFSGNDIKIELNLISY